MRSYILHYDLFNQNGRMKPITLISLSVSENKVLTHPSSVDSLTTSAGTEDHVSMGGFAARKCVTVVEHVEIGRPTKSLDLPTHQDCLFSQAIKIFRCLNYRLCIGV